MTSFRDNLSELFGRYPYDDAFIEALRQHVTRDCSKIPVHIHKRTQAQNRLELAAKESIVLYFDQAFPDAWFPFQLRPGWPHAHCIIKGNSARIEFSFGPETDGERGGQEIEPVEFAIIRAKPNILTRAARAFMGRDQKTERQPELPPVGTPDGRPELKLKTPVKSAAKVAATAAKPVQHELCQSKGKSRGRGSSDGDVR